jgi:biopolymer transport protein ExbB
MSAWEYLHSGSWCMYLIAISGVILYTLLVERLLFVYQQDKIPREQQDDSLLFIRALIAAIPLLGLLGTVTGMMDSFQAMRSAEYEIGMGISQALLTTQYGLVLAAPALLIERLISVRLQAMQAKPGVTTS